MTDSIERMPTHPRSTVESDKAILKKEVESAKKSGNLLEWLSDFFKSNEKAISKIPFVGALIGLINLIIKYQEISEGKPDTESRLEALAGTIETDEGEPEVTDSELEEILKKESESTKPKSKPYDLNAFKHIGKEKKKEDMTPEEIDERENDPRRLIGYIKAESGWTLCSGTAMGNLKKLVQLSGSEKKKVVVIRNLDDIKRIIKSVKDDPSLSLKDFIPQGDADKVEYFYQKTQAEMKFGLKEDMIEALDASGKTLCDVVTHGSSKYGHRSVGFKATDGKWYVVDPYKKYKGQISTKPIPFEEYEVRVKFVVPI